MWLPHLEVKEDQKQQNAVDWAENCGKYDIKYAIISDGNIEALLIASVGDLVILYKDGSFGGTEFINDFEKLERYYIVKETKWEKNYSKQFIIDFLRE